MSALLAIDELRVSVSTRAGVVEAVHGISYEVDRAQVLGIVGESGSGKSLSVLALLGLLPRGVQARGSAVFEGENLLGMSASELRRVRGARISMIFQDPTATLHPLLRIERQVTEHARVHLGLSRKAARQRAIELLTEVRLPDPERALRSYPHQFSGGMRQRVAIAAALACEPDLVIADEPTTALDVTVQASILRLLSDVCRAKARALIIITHDLAVMAALADAVMVMYAGRVVEAGATADVLRRSRHPYTYGLLGALPGAGAREAGPTLRPISGAPPALGAEPSGCSYRTRCPFAVTSCALAIPRLHEVGRDHMIACSPDPLKEAR